jgi:uncharacterized protein (DUF1501 family)
MTITRRTLLQGLGGGLVAGQLSFLPRLARASSANAYQALVCIFLYGGNDGNNTVVPLDPPNYKLYQQYRSYLALSAANGNAPLPLGKTAYGLHPALKKTSQLWDSGNLSVLLNIGTSIEPGLTVAGYTANPNGPNVPANLFSHEDQRNEWKSAVYQGGSVTGWGGRLASNFAASGDGNVAPMLSFAGPDLFTLAAAQEPLCLPATGSFLINAFPGKYGASVAAARETLYAESQSHYRNDAIQAVQSLTASGVAASGLINPILQGTNASIDPLFATLDSSIASQLHGVAKLIAQQSQLGAQTQVFYVDLGNFDTHHGQLETQQTLLSQLDDAVSAFYAATVALGVAKNVTTFTMSDFSRTYIPNTTGGTDHAWGNHHFVIGGSVKPQTVVGRLPTLNPFGDGPVGPQDVDTEGRWLPDFSVDQYAATLANWVGLSHAEILDVVPNLVNFSTTPTLGFLNPLT